MNNYLHTFLIPLLLISFVLHSCDFISGTPAEEEEVFSVTNDVESRVIYYGDPAKVSEIPEAGSVADMLTIRARVRPPIVNGELTRASHIDYANGFITAGYKVWRPNSYAYGGGIDILEVGSGSVIASARSMQSNTFDVQEVSYNWLDRTVFVAGAMERKELDDPKAWVFRISGTDGTMEAKAGIDGNVAKSLALRGPDVYVINEQNSIYRFNQNLTNSNQLSVDSQIRFRNIHSVSPNQVVALCQNGILHWTHPNFRSISNTYNALGRRLQADHGIARISQFTHSGSDHLAVALNEHGFIVYNGGNRFSSITDWFFHNGENVTQQVRNRIQNRNYTSVIGISGSGPMLIMAAGVGTNEAPVIDLFELTFSGNYTANYLGHLDLSQYGDLSMAQINHIHAEGGYLYVAKSTDGVVIFEMN
ncbi:MAG: hypothetical protein EA360_10990 [Balneolaceae bacterium]|nr:MAG: hypothetical protein EA360_10990 [Balneolaceae bacterium]